jgi:hypothetical protein
MVMWKMLGQAKTLEWLQCKALTARGLDPLSMEYPSAPSLLFHFLRKAIANIRSDLVDTVLVDMLRVPVSPDAPDGIDHKVLEQFATTRFSLLYTTVVHHNAEALKTLLRLGADATVLVHTEAFHKPQLVFQRMLQHAFTSADQDLVVVFLDKDDASNWRRFQPLSDTRTFVNMERLIEASGGVVAPAIIAAAKRWDERHEQYMSARARAKFPLKSVASAGAGAGSSTDAL